MNNSNSLHVRPTGITKEERQLQQLLQLISDICCIFAEDGYYQQLNADCWKNLLGWSESELIGKPMLEFLHPEDIEVTSKALSKLRKNQIIELNARHLHKDGSFRWISWRINKNEDELICGVGKEITLTNLRQKLKYESYLADNENRTESTYFTFNELEETRHNINLLTSGCKKNSDIGDDLQLDNKLEENISYKKSLQPLFINQEESTLEKIITSIPQGILLLDSQHKIILANQSIWDYLKLIGGVNCDNILYKLGGTSLEKLIDKSQDKIVLEIIPQNFPQIVLEVVVKLIISNSKQHQWLVIVNDISAFGQIDSALCKALKKEKELNTLKSSVINTVSHEYRTPLTNILLGVQLLKKYHNKLDLQRQMRCLEHIETSGKHLVELVDNMLLISTAESSKIELHRVHLNLVSFTQQLVENFQIVRNNSHTLNFKHSCLNSEAYLDSILLRQILTNLLSNAIKYSPNGGEVNLHLTCNQSFALFKLQDQGIGILEKDKQKLFESFQRGSNAGTIQGTGLGLAIVKKCVELHGGQIWFDSMIGKGTTFYVKLPY